MIKLHNYFNLYSKISKKPRKIHLLLVSPTVLRRGIPAIKSFIWFLRSSHEDKFEGQLGSELPTIELLWVVSKKDFDILKVSVLSAIRNTMNPIKRINLVVPDKDFFEANDILIENTYEIVIKKDSEIISQESIEKIRKHFGQSSGWVLQQFLKLNFVIKSNSNGILVIDGDTVLKHKTIWLNVDTSQIFLMATSKHLPYFHTLSQLGYPLKKPKYSFVTHHMLFQPTFLRRALGTVGCKSIEQFIELLIKNIEPKNYGNISLDYEFYGTYMFDFHRDKVLLSRFCNLSLNRNSFQKSIYNSLNDIDLVEEYKSVSFHSWNSN